MPLSRRLAESVVVVTGASSGIGAATAVALAGTGASVVLAARRGDDLRTVAERCAAAGGRALAVPTDVTDPTAVAALADRAVAVFGRIDGWVNNAAVALYAPLLSAPVDEVRRVLETNLLGYLHGVRAALPALRSAGGGVVVNVASLLGVVTVPTLGAYTMSKFAVMALSGTLRQELLAAGDRSVSVCSVLPPYVATPLYGHAANRTGRRVRPLPPVQRPATVAGAIVRALRRPRRTVYTGLTGRVLATQARLAPGATERLLARYGVHMLTDRPAPPTTGNLAEPAGPRPAVGSSGPRPPKSARDRIDRAGNGNPTGMAHVERVVAAAPDRVFAVLADGWTYSDWVVGTAHIRAVDADWPAEGARLHHKVGPWPVSIRDRSVSMRCEPPRLLVLKVRIWPLGEGVVRFELAGVGDRSTRVALREEFTGGPLRGLRTKVNDLLLHARNVETLRRLDDLVTRRAPRRGTDEPGT